jgi:Fur family ferric uptake transcriptional regulator/Fur family peroxide stress response transcriptional regulator
MNKREELFNDLRKQNIRITKQRKAIIDVLEDNHLTIQEIYAELKKRGFSNLGTVYNNIDFLLEHKIVTQLFINGKKHYDLTIDEDSHDADSHIHVTCKVENKIVEINHSDIFDTIKKHPIFANFEIDKIQLQIEGVCKDSENGECQRTGHCFLEELDNAN